MRNLIRADMYRIVRNPGFYFALALFIAYVVNLIVQDIDVEAAFAVPLSEYGLTAELIEGDEIVDWDGSPMVRVIYRNTYGEFWDDMAWDNKYGPEDLKFRMEHIKDSFKKTGNFAPFYMAQLASDPLSNPLMQFFPHTTTLIFVLLPVVMLVAGADVAGVGTARNVIAGGMTRTKYYLTKLSLMALFFAGLTLIYILLPMAIATFVNGWGEPFTDNYFSELAKILLPQLFLAFGYGCIGMFLLFSVRNTAALVTVYIAYVILPFFFKDIVGYDFAYYQYDLQYLIYRFANMYERLGWSNTQPAQPSFAHTLFVGGAYILATSFVGITLFKKRELK